MPDWANLSLFVGSVSAAVAGLIVATQKSKCSHIECCCIKCDRTVQDNIEISDIENQLENVTTQPEPTKPTPKRTFNGGLPVRPNLP